MYISKGYFAKKGVSLPISEDFSKMDTHFEGFSLKIYKANFPNVFGFYHI